LAAKQLRAPRPHLEPNAVGPAIGAQRISTAWGQRQQPREPTVSTHQIEREL